MILRGCVYCAVRSKYIVIFSLEILNLYWDFLVPFRGGSIYLC